MLHVHEVAPVDDVEFAGQAVHACPPAAALYVPAAHTEHENDEPVPVEPYPALHPHEDPADDTEFAGQAVHVSVEPDPVCPYPALHVHV